MPDSLNLPNRQWVFVMAMAAHRWAVERLRSRLVVTSTSASLREEATAIALREFGLSPGGSGDSIGQEGSAADDEWGITATQIETHLEQTASHLRGLAIAGLYHQWERHVRAVIFAFPTKKYTTEEIYDINKADFPELAEMLGRVGFKFTAHPGYRPMDTMRLIANTVKHGEGISFAQLLTRRPDLFPPTKLVASPRPDDIILNERDFDEAAEAISRTWEACEAAVTARLRYR